MQRSLSHRYQQGQSQFQLEAISFFDDRPGSDAPLLPGFGRSGDFRCQCSVHLHNTPVLKARSLAVKPNHSYLVSL
jgi:hypothetical protein